MAHQWPRCADTKVCLEILAQQHEEPSIESLMEPSDTNDAQHTANWETVLQQVDNIDANGLHEHMHLSSHI